MQFTHRYIYSSRGILCRSSVYKQNCRLATFQFFAQSTSSRPAFPRFENKQQNQMDSTIYEESKYDVWSEEDWTMKLEEWKQTGLPIRKCPVIFQICFGFESFRAVELEHCQRHDSTKKLQMLRTLVTSMLIQRYRR